MKVKDDALRKVCHLRAGSKSDNLKRSPDRSHISLVDISCCIYAKLSEMFALPNIIWKKAYALLCCLRCVLEYTAFNMLS